MTRPPANDDRWKRLDDVESLRPRTDEEAVAMRRQRDARVPCDVERQQIGDVVIVGGDREVPMNARIASVTYAGAVQFTSIFVRKERSVTSARYGSDIARRNERGGL